MGEDCDKSYELGAPAVLFFSSGDSSSGTLIFFLPKWRDFMFSSFKYMYTKIYHANGKRKKRRNVARPGFCYQSGSFVLERHAYLMWVTNEWRIFYFRAKHKFSVWVRQLMNPSVLEMIASTWLFCVRAAEMCMPKYLMKKRAHWVSH